MQERILVTGASGFIGRKLSFRLAQEGYHVIAFCRNSSQLILHPNIEIIKGDILDLESLKAAMKDCKVVFHTAALAKMWSKNKRDFYDVNVVGTRNVCLAAIHHQVSKLIYTSSCGVLGPTLHSPMTENDPRIVGFPIEYERTKYLAELEADKFSDDLAIVTLRPSRVYGDGPITGSNTVSRMIDAYIRGKWKFVPGKGVSIANYVFVDDVVEGHVAAMKKIEQSEKFILGGDDVSFKQFFDTLTDISGVRHKLYEIPISLVEWYGRLQSVKTNIFGTEPQILPEFAERLKYNQKYSSQKAIDYLDYKITPFKEGMKTTVDFIINNQWKNIQQL